MSLKLFLEDKIVNSNEAYLLGFFYADGYIPKADKYGKSRAIVVTLARKDEEHLRNIQELMGVGAIKLKESKCNGKSYPTVQYAYYDTIFATKLIGYGIVPRKTYVDDSYVFDNIPDEFKWDFIRGYFDGDGSVHGAGRKKSVSVSFVSLNQKLLKSIQIYVNPQIGQIRSDGLILSKDGKYFRLRSGGARIVFTFLNFLYEDSSFHMKRKFYLFKEMTKNHIQEKASDYLNLSFKGGKWHVKVDDLSFGSYPEEVIAAEVRDKIALYLYKGEIRLNFPEKKQEYLEIDLEKFYNGTLKARKSKYKNIYFCKPKGRWIATTNVVNGKRRYIGQFETEELAFAAQQRFFKKDID